MAHGPSIGYNLGMRPKVYIETTVVSYLTADPSRDLRILARQEATKRIWPRLKAECDLFVSCIGRDEVPPGNPEAAAIAGLPVLGVDSPAARLAATLVKAGAFAERAANNALHVAVAATRGMDFILTWNFAHISNGLTRFKIRRIVHQNGFRCPEICSPEGLFGQAIKDPIVEEIRRIRREHAREFNYDIHAICEDLRKFQAACGHPVVRPAPKMLERARRRRKA